MNRASFKKLKVIRNGYPIQEEDYTTLTDLYVVDVGSKRLWWYNDKIFYSLLKTNIQDRAYPSRRPGHSKQEAGSESLRGDRKGCFQWNNLVTKKLNKQKEEGKDY